MWIRSGPMPTSLNRFSSISSSTRVGWAGAGAWAWKRRLSWESLWDFSGGRLQVDKLAAVVLHFDGFWWVVRRVWVVLVVARVLICLVRAFQFFEVAVVEFGGQAVGFASGTLPHRSVPPSLNLVTCNGAFAQVNRRTTRFLGK